MNKGPTQSTGDLLPFSPVLQERCAHGQERCRRGGAHSRVEAGGSMWGDLSLFDCCIEYEEYPQQRFKLVQGIGGCTVAQCAFGGVVDLHK